MTQAPVRLIVRRVRPTPGSQLALFTSYSYHAFITDREGDTLELEADHRRHAEIENAIRDLKYGVGLNHLPSGRFAANAAWMAVQVMAHNLARWTARIGLGEQVVTTRTLRRRFFALVGRLTRSARRLTLHLPQGWPWGNLFSRFSRVLIPQLLYDELQNVVYTMRINRPPVAYIGKDEEGRYTHTELPEDDWVKRLEYAEAVLKLADSLERIPSYPILDADDPEGANRRHNPGRCRCSPCW